MLQKPDLRALIVAFFLICYSLWVLYSLAHAVLYGSFHTLAIRHNAHLLRYSDEPIFFLASLAIYVVSGPLLAIFHIYINIILAMRKPLPAPPRPPKQEELLENPAKISRWDGPVS